MTTVGITAGLPRPGGNFTGVTFQANAERLSTLEPKYLEMLKELVPTLSHAALLRVPADNFAAANTNETALAAAHSLGIRRLSILETRDPEDLKRSFIAIERDKPQGLVAPASGLLYAHRREVIEFAAKTRLPTVYGLRELVPEGGLMALSPSLAETASRGAFYVDRIFKGAKPADLPVEQPTKFELVINLKTAKALVLTIPSSLLQRADQVIE
jgi:putative ABC transport system substrate-binding protein